MSSPWVSIQGSMIKQFGQENPNVVQIFFSPNSCPAGNKLEKKVAQKSDFTA